MPNKRELHQQLYNRAKTLADNIEQFTRPLLESLATRETALQLRDASSSAAANYKAAGGGRSHDEFTSKMGTVSEETDESVHWLESLRDTGRCRGARLDALLDEAQQLARIFGKSYSTARRNKESRQRRRRRRR